MGLFIASAVDALRQTVYSQRTLAPETRNHRGRRHERGSTLLRDKHRLYRRALILLLKVHNSMFLQSQRFFFRLDTICCIAFFVFDAMWLLFTEDILSAPRPFNRPWCAFISASLRFRPSSGSCSPKMRKVPTIAKITVNSFWRACRRSLKSS